MAMLSTLTESVLDLLFPPTCLGCGERVYVTDHRPYLCERCEKRIVLLGQNVCQRCGIPSEEGRVSGCSHCPKFETFYSMSRSACVYSNPIRELIHEFKFEGNRRVRPFLAEIFVNGANRHLDRKEFDVIVPVPLHRWRRFQREFNQAEWLGESLSENWDVPLLPQAVKRVRMTLPQSQLPGKWRESNIRGAFGVGKQSVAGARVLLVDDVMTTGRTLAACAAVLVQAGAENVIGYTLARRV